MSVAEKKRIHGRKRIQQATSPLLELHFSQNDSRVKQKDIEWRIRQFVASAMAIRSAVQSFKFATEDAAAFQEHDAEFVAQIASLGRHILFVTLRCP